MRRTTLRFFAAVILALLGVPVALHVVLHDLHADEEQHLDAYSNDAHHGDHEHPIVSSAVPSLGRVALPVVVVPSAIPTTSTRTVRMERNVIAHGAVRLDDDVGLQLLLATFLI